MASEVLTLTAQIVMSHASMTELTTKEQVKEIKEVYGILASLEAEVVVPETAAPVARSRKTRAMVVTCPWPWGVAPVVTRTFPDDSTWTIAPSYGPSPVPST